MSPKRRKEKKWITKETGKKKEKKQLTRMYICLGNEKMETDKYMKENILTMELNKKRGKAIVLKTVMTKNNGEVEN